MNNMGYVLEINNLTKKYPAFELKPVSFHIEAGEVMGFIGRNGAGKTTTLKSILNLVHPDAGSVRILGMDYLDNEDKIKQQIGYAVGGINYYKREKLKDIVAITRIFYENWDNETYRHYLDAFKLDENKRIMELSEGMKVKFYLTLALSHHAKLLILDEPTSGLDPVSRDEMNEIFRKLAEKGVAILFSTHITSDLEKCADTITYIKNGELLLSAKKEDFIHHYTEEIGGAPTLEDIMVHIEREEVNL
ncbi:ABC transporter ATP-binding protein [Streptococcus sp. FDAARGOS_146]|nr:ABC transporter ATP-binding protein [Streptococcus sp. FDAARGOS_146]